MPEDDNEVEQRKKKKAVEATFTDDGKTKEISIRYDDGTTEKIPFIEQSRIKVASRHPRWDDHMENTESHNKNESSNNKETER